MTLVTRSARCHSTLVFYILAASARRTAGIARCLRVLREPLAAFAVPALPHGVNSSHASRFRVSRQQETPMKRNILTVLILSCMASSALAQTVIDESKLIRPTQTQPAQSAPAPPAVYTIPAGTTILARLTSPLHTTSATVGSGVYMETTYPVVVNDRVVVPPRSCVLGSIERDQRPGRAHGRAQFRFLFHTLVLPSNHSISIVGSLQGLPGSALNRRTDARGTTEPVDQIDHDVHTMVKGTAAGAGLGFFIGRSPTTTLVGTAAGGAAALAKVLFTRGDDISLPVGTMVELVLEHPATVEARDVP
jgi:hypothetical protein